MKVKPNYYPSLLLLFFILFTACTTADEQSAPSLAVEILEKAHAEFKEKSITHRRFKHADLQPLIEKHSDQFKITSLGTSIEGRSISSLDWGKGETKVMLWSQMHGNESTATMALFDIFNFLEGDSDEYQELRTILRERLTLKFIPMINPDGAEEFKRRNALDIDLNRDAISQISPEAIILKEARDNFEPDFGFNLHDQQTYYNAEGTAKQATISVLAPAYNEATDINEVRKRAMQTIVGMNKVLQQIVPGHVGKYNDAFEPRAFGDNIQKWGTSTILIESGGYPKDPDKQFIRQLNFMIILEALHQIAIESYTQYSVDEYFSIPDNDLQLVDLLIHEAQVRVGEKLYPMDLGIRRRQSTSGSTYYSSSSIDDLGDLQVYFGLEELDASNMLITEGKVYPEVFESLSDLDQDRAMDLLREGFLAVKVENNSEGELHGLPILVLSSSDTFSWGWKTGSVPNFFLSKGNQLKFAVVNGYLIDLENPKEQEFKQRIY